MSETDVKDKNKKIVNMFYDNPFQIDEHDENLNPRLSTKHFKQQSLQNVSLIALQTCISNPQNHIDLNLNQHLE